MSLHRPGSLSQSNTAIRKLIRDAIGLVQNIGEKFLWVDALCIVQDDEQEMMSEIARMGFIFSQAYLTIVATDDQGADYGLPGISHFTSRDIVQLAAEYLPGRHLITAQSDLFRVFYQCKWNERGWTLQEGIFSKRALFLTNKGAYFRCQRTVWCETAAAEMQHLRHYYQMNGFF